MPVQIQNDVDPVYEPIITIPDTGEVLTEAQVYDTTLALANRIEFVRTLTPEAADRPETYATLREDFFGAIYTSGQARIDASFPWRTAALGSPAVNGRAGSAKNPGLLEVALPGDGANAHTFAFYLQSASGAPFSFDTFEQLTVAVKIENDPANIAHAVTFGLASEPDAQNGGDESILVYFQPAVNPTNWLCLKRVGGAQTTTTLGSAIFANGEFAVWDIKKLSTGQFRLYLNGVAQMTINAVDLPSGGCNLSFNQVHTAAETEVTRISWDFISLRTKPDDRSGP